MPECRDCGNTARFTHYVEGNQTRVYDESGDYQATETERLDTHAMWCAECDSEAVTVE